MGKKAKEHRKKVAKRNASLKSQEKRMQKLWQEAFQEQMDVMKKRFESMSGETGVFDGEDKIDDVISELNNLEEKLNTDEAVDIESVSLNVKNIADILEVNLDEEKSQEGQESIEPIQ